MFSFNMADYSPNFREEVEDQRKQIAEFEKLYEKNTAGEANLAKEMADTREAIRKAKKKNASIKAKTQRECAGSQITEVTAYVLAARAHKLKERYMNAVNGMIAIDALLNQQSKVVADAAAQFDFTELKAVNNALKNNIYDLLRYVDEADVDILDLKNAKLSMTDALIETGQTMRMISDVSNECAKMDAGIAAARTQVEELTGEMNGLRLKYNQAEEEIIEISIKLDRLNDNQ